MTVNGDAPGPDGNLTLTLERLSGGTIDPGLLPSSVHDVLEFSSFESFPSPGALGRLYVARDTGALYRWTGAAYVLAAYLKPASGIPAADLSKSVRDSLAAADSALQAHQSLADYYTRGEVNSLVASATPSDYDSLKGRVSAVEGKVPSAASASNQLADKAYVATEISGLLSDGRIKASLLPSYVDDVLEYDGLAGFPGTGETGKIYVAKDTNKTYRWGGSSYIEVSAGVTTDATASASGLMSASDKSKLDGIAAGATAVTVDPALSGSSANPVENRAVSEALAGKFDKADEDVKVSFDDENKGLKVADYADLYHVILHLQGITANWPDGNDKKFLFPRHPPSNKNTLALLQNIAPDFSTSASYAVDDLCVRSGQLFRCTTAHAPDDWNVDHFQLATVQDVLASLCSIIAARPTKVALDEGWWADWAFSGGVEEGVTYSIDIYEPIAGTWNADLSANGNIISHAGVSGEDVDSIVFTTGLSTPITATRRRIAGPTPTKTSDLVNDGDGTSPFAKVSQLPSVPTDVSAFTNDAEYVTQDELEEAITGAIDDAGSMDEAKADKYIPAAAGNLASLTTDGNLADSGKKPADFAPSSDIQKSALSSDVQDLLDRELVYEDGSWHADSLLDDEEHDVRVVEVVSGPTYHDGNWTAQFLYNNGVTQQLSASGAEDATELKFGPNGTTAVFSRVPAGYVLREPTRSRSAVPASAKVQPAGFYADRSEMSVTAGTGDDADKTTIQLKEGVSATVLTAHQDISGKADASDVETALAGKADNSDVSDLRDYVDGLFNYKAITASLSITASSPSLGSGESQTVREKGRTVTAATFHYVFNKVPVEAKFGTANPPTEAVANPALSGDIAKTGMLVTSATTWRVSGKEAEVPGKTQQTATASATINFYNGVYYGVAAIPGTLDSAFILGLANKSLRSGKLTSFTVNAGAGQHIWYALPESMGVCAFKVGGFDGGFTLADTIQFTNSVGHAESYRVYRSDNASLGNTTVNVS